MEGGSTNPKRPPFNTGYLPLNYSGNPGVCGVSYRGVHGKRWGFVAQGSADGKTVVVRITNMGENPATTELVVPGFSGIAKPTTWTLQVSRRC